MTFSHCLPVAVVPVRVKALVVEEVAGIDRQVFGFGIRALFVVAPLVAAGCSSESSSRSPGSPCAGTQAGRLGAALSIAHAGGPGGRWEGSQSRCSESGGEPSLRSSMARPVSARLEVVDTDTKDA